MKFNCSSLAFREGFWKQDEFLLDFGALNALPHGAVPRSIVIRNPALKKTFATF
jgi:hypothetical protein